MATNFNQDQPQTIIGQKTPRAQIFKSESHKLNQAFCPKKGDIIAQGMPVKLNEDGTISPYTGEGIYLGIAHTDNISPAYQAQRGFPVEVTVMVEAFAIVHAAVASELTTCGYVKPTATLAAGRFVTYEASVEETKFINITPAATGEVMQVLVR